MNGESTDPPAGERRFRPCSAARPLLRPGDATSPRRSLARPLRVAARGEQVRIAGSGCDRRGPRRAPARGATAGAAAPRAADPVRRAPRPRSTRTTSPSSSESAAEACDCKWGARGISVDDLLDQLDDARRHAADEGEQPRRPRDLRRSSVVRGSPRPPIGVARRPSAREPRRWTGSPGRGPASRRPSDGAMMIPAIRVYRLADVLLLGYRQRR